MWFLFKGASTAVLAWGCGTRAAMILSRRVTHSGLVTNTLTVVLSSSSPRGFAITSRIRVSSRTPTRAVRRSLAASAAVAMRRASASFPASLHIRCGKCRDVPAHVPGIDYHHN